MIGAVSYLEVIFEDEVWRARRTNNKKTSENFLRWFLNPNGYDTMKNSEIYLFSYSESEFTTYL